MKKNPQFRLKLHRETVRTLTSPELAALGGAAEITGTASLTCPVSCQGTCHVPCTLTGQA